MGIIRRELVPEDVAEPAGLPAEGSAMPGGYCGKKWEPIRGLRSKADILGNDQWSIHPPFENGGARREFTPEGAGVSLIRRNEMGILLFPADECELFIERLGKIFAKIIII